MPRSISAPLPITSTVSTAAASSSLCRSGWSPSIVLLMPGLAETARAAQATPGKDGVGGTLSGTINAYWPGTASPGVGTLTSISLGPRSGAAETIEAGDLLLVIQIQGADIDSTQSGTLWRWRCR